MTPEERDRVIAKLTAGWASKVSDPHMLVWWEELDRLDYGRAQKAMTTLVQSAKRRPSIAEFLEEYRDQPSSAKALPAAQCGMCENGFVDIHPEQVGWPRTYGRCPNGCRPMTAIERAQYWQDRERTDPAVRRPVGDPWKDRMEKEEVF
jgi:hypothetical protein